MGTVELKYYALCLHEKKIGKSQNLSKKSHSEKLVLGKFPRGT